jgi:PAS domain S-box-containing protein
MAFPDEEDDRLRTAALRNAQSILAARQRAEEELRKQSEWLRITLASIGDAVISTDGAGGVTFMNTVAEALTGWPQADAIGRPLPEVFRIVHDETRTPMENPAIRALEPGAVVSPADRTVLISRTGAEHRIEHKAAPIRDEVGSAVGAVLVFRDVSEGRRTELARAHLAAIVDSSEDAIVSKTLRGIILSWNTGAERLFGYSSPEAVGQPITILIPPERINEEDEILSRIARGERIEHFETVRVTSDGRRLDVSLTVSPIRDVSGEIIGVSKIARDITDRRLAEQALREADRKKDEFIALLAHELRNPLAPMRSALQVMRAAPSDAKALTGARHVMERQLGHMVRLIDDLLDISRIGQQKLELRRTRVTLADVVHSAVETARPVIDASGHRLAVSLPASPVHLDGDLTRLSQVFSNLLTNSAKYTHPGGLIELVAEATNEKVRVSVRDNGIGVPAGALESIFDMFSQVDRSLEHSTGGLGIGLALVRGLVEMHGGTVTAASDGQDRGSTFTVTLPVLTSVSASIPPFASPAEASPAAQRRRVLVVDDSRDAAEMMAMMLEFMGNEVRTAFTGTQAIAAAGAFRPELILMDIGMPELDGYEAARRIRDEPWGRDICIIALTGWGQDRDRVRSREAGCDGHLVKPVEPAALERLLADFGVQRPLADRSAT